MILESKKSMSYQEMKLHRIDGKGRIIRGLKEVSAHVGEEGMPQRPCIASEKLES